MKRLKEQKLRIMIMEDAKIRIDIFLMKRRHVTTCLKEGYNKDLHSRENNERRELMAGELLAK